MSIEEITTNNNYKKLVANNLIGIFLASHTECNFSSRDIHKTVSTSQNKKRANNIGLTRYEELHRISVLSAKTEI